MQAHVQTSLLPLCRHLQIDVLGHRDPHIDLDVSLHPTDPFLRLVSVARHKRRGRLAPSGRGKKFQTAAEVRDELFAWNWLGFCVAIFGGFLLSARATMYIINPAFRTKLFALIPTALLWHIVVQAKTREWGKSMGNPPRGEALRLA